MVRSYCRLTVFMLGLLVGVQCPAFMDQYYKRVDAHLLEAKRGLEGFQATADRYFNGDIQALISHYASSESDAIQHDADSLRTIYERARRFNAEMQALQGPWYAVAYHMLLSSNTEVLRETMDQFSHAILLNQQAIVWGIGVGLLMSVGIELLIVLIFRLLRVRAKDRYSYY